MGRGGGGGGGGGSGGGGAGGAVSDGEGLTWVELLFMYKHRPASVDVLSWDGNVLTIYSVTKYLTSFVLFTQYQYLNYCKILPHL